MIPKLKQLYGSMYSLTAMPRAAMLLLAAGVGALGFAFIMQFFLGYDPCILCLWQRFPYGFTAVFAAIALLRRPYGRRSVVPLALIALCFAVGAGLAVFHTGVEQHWWLGTEGCAVKPLNAQTVEDIRTQLLGTLTAHCDEISWTFLGLSMANWNVPLSLALLVFTGVALRRCLFADTEIAKNNIQ